MTGPFCRNVRQRFGADMWNSAKPSVFRVSRHKETPCPALSVLVSRQWYPALGSVDLITLYFMAGILTAHSGRIKVTTTIIC